MITVHDPERRAGCITDVGMTVSEAVAFEALGRAPRPFERFRYRHGLVGNVLELNNEVLPDEGMFAACAAREGGCARFGYGLAAGGVPFPRTDRDIGHPDEAGIGCGEDAASSPCSSSRRRSAGVSSALNLPGVLGVEPCHREMSMRKMSGPKMGMVDARSGSWSGSQRRHLL
jgi:hypothetical protein